VAEVMIYMYCRIIVHLKPSKGDTPIRANGFRNVVWKYMKESCLQGKGYKGDEYDPLLAREATIELIDVPKKQAGYQVECITCAFRGSPGECRPLTKHEHGLFAGQVDLKTRIREYLINTGTGEKDADRVVGLERVGD